MFSSYPLISAAVTPPSSQIIWYILANKSEKHATLDLNSTLNAPLIIYNFCNAILFQLYFPKMELT